MIIGLGVGSSVCLCFGWVLCSLVSVPSLVFWPKWSGVLMEQLFRSNRVSPVVVLWPKGPLDFGYQYCLCGSKYLCGLWGSRYLYGLGDSLYSVPASRQKISSKAVAWEWSSGVGCYWRLLGQF